MLTPGNFDSELQPIIARTVRAGRGGKAFRDLTLGVTGSLLADQLKHVLDREKQENAKQVDKKVRPDILNSFQPGWTQGGEEAVLSKLLTLKSKYAGNPDAQELINDYKDIVQTTQIIGAIDEVGVQVEANHILTRAEMSEQTKKVIGVVEKVGSKNRALMRKIFDEKLGQKFDELIDRSEAIDEKVGYLTARAMRADEAAERQAKVRLFSNSFVFAGGIVRAFGGDEDLARHLESTLPAIVTVVDSISTISSIVSGATSGSVFGPVGTLIGGLTGILGGLFGGGGDGLGEALQTISKQLQGISENLVAVSKQVTALHKDLIDIANGLDEKLTLIGDLLDQRTRDILFNQAKSLRNQENLYRFVSQQFAKVNVKLSQLGNLISNGQEFDKAFREELYEWLKELNSDTYKASAFWVEHHQDIFPLTPEDYKGYIKDIVQWGVDEAKTPLLTGASAELGSSGEVNVQLDRGIREYLGINTGLLVKFAQQFNMTFTHQPANLYMWADSVKTFLSLFQNTPLAVLEAAHTGLNNNADWQDGVNNIYQKLVAIGEENQAILLKLAKQPKFFEWLFHAYEQSIRDLVKTVQEENSHFVKDTIRKLHDESAFTDASNDFFAAIQALKAYPKQTISTIFLQTKLFDIKKLVPRSRLGSRMEGGTTPAGYQVRFPFCVMRDFVCHKNSGGLISELYRSDFLRNPSDTEVGDIVSKLNIHTPDVREDQGYRGVDNSPQCHRNSAAVSGSFAPGGSCAIQLFWGGEQKNECTNHMSEAISTLESQSLLEGKSIPAEIALEAERSSIAECSTNRDILKREVSLNLYYLADYQSSPFKPISCLAHNSLSESKYNGMVSHPVLKAAHAFNIFDLPLFGKLDSIANENIPSIFVWAEMLGIGRINYEYDTHKPLVLRVKFLVMPNYQHYFEKADEVVISEQFLSKFVLDDHPRDAKACGLVPEFGLSIMPKSFPPILCQWYIRALNGTVTTEDAWQFDPLSKMSNKTHHSTFKGAKELVTPQHRSKLIEQGREALNARQRELAIDFKKYLLTLSNNEVLSEHDEKNTLRKVLLEVDKFAKLLYYYVALVFGYDKVNNPNLHQATFLALFSETVHGFDNLYNIRSLFAERYPDELQRPVTDEILRYITEEGYQLYKKAVLSHAKAAQVGNQTDLPVGFPDLDYMVNYLEMQRMQFRTTVDSVAAPSKLDEFMLGVQSLPINVTLNEIAKARLFSAENNTLSWHELLSDDDVLLSLYFSPFRPLLDHIVNASVTYQPGGDRARRATGESGERLIFNDVQVVPMTGQGYCNLLAEMFVWNETASDLLTVLGLPTVCDLSKNLVVQQEGGFVGPRETTDDGVFSQAGGIAAVTIASVLAVVTISMAVVMRRRHGQGQGVAEQVATLAAAGIVMNQLPGNPGIVTEAAMILNHDEFNVHSAHDEALPNENTTGFSGADPSDHVAVKGRVVVLNGQKFFHHQGRGYELFVINQATLGANLSKTANRTSNIYQPENCWPIDFYGRPSVVCDADHTGLIYRPVEVAAHEHVVGYLAQQGVDETVAKVVLQPFADVTGNIMLGQVVWHVAKQAYEGVGNYLSDWWHGRVTQAPAYLDHDEVLLSLQAHNDALAYYTAELRQARTIHPTVDWYAAEFMLDECSRNLAELARNTARITADHLAGLADDVNAYHLAYNDALQVTKQPESSINCSLPLDDRSNQKVLASHATLFGSPSQLAANAEHMQKLACVAGLSC